MNPSSRSRKEEWFSQFFGWVPAVLLFVGAIALAVSLSVLLGLVPIPPNVQWPVECSSNVVVTHDRTHVVPQWYAGRVQTYDAAGRFIRGWRVEAYGGAFTLDVTNQDTIAVRTARQFRTYEFSIQGALLAEGTYEPGTYSRSPVAGAEWCAPGNPVLLALFGGPIGPALLIVAGILLILLHDWLQARRR